MTRKNPLSAQEELAKAREELKNEKENNTAIKTRVSQFESTPDYLLRSEVASDQAVRKAQQKVASCEQKVNELSKSQDKPQEEPSSFRP